VPVDNRSDPRRCAALFELAAKVPGASFSFVMATGIVSVAAELQAFHWVALVLFAINVIAFLGLSLLNLRRLAREPAVVLGELSCHRTAASFLTIVAGAGILGNQFALLTSDQQLAASLWLVACALWAAMVYGLFVGLTIRPKKPPLATGLDGSWLLVVVASESLTILGTHVASVFSRPEIVVYLSLCWFLFGGLFYLIIISLILYRWLFEPMRPAQLTPPYWINMGAAAIATLAGARLEAIAGTSALLARLVPPITAAAVLSWTIATWWIPLLLALLFWRHVVGRIRLSYRLEYWSMVFPLGMYTAATWTFARENCLDFLNAIPRVFLWIAFAAWLATFAGMMRRAFGPIHSDR
jgi:tellurite resistance protein TehA-like permease